MSLNQYASQRFLGLGALTLERQSAHRGIAAGCGFATTWVQIYSLPPLRLRQAQHPHVSLTVFIDDLGGECSSTQEHLVVGRLAAGAASLWQCIQEDLDSKVAEHKSVLLASSDLLAPPCLRGVCELRAEGGLQPRGGHYRRPQEGH